MEQTKIEWADHTFNPWIGCTQVSPGCTNCYALTLNKRWAGGKNWGQGAPRRRTSEANWREPLKWNKVAICSQCGEDDIHERTRCLLCGGAMRRPRVFCASLADWLDDEVKIEWLADLLKLIHATPHLDWLLLTKRPENFESRLVQVCVEFCKDSRYLEMLHWLGSWIASNGLAKDVPANAWIGTTVENQAMADKRIPLLLSIPAKVRFLSCEPLLEAIDLRLRDHLTLQSPEWSAQRHVESQRRMQGIDWVITGGESGPGARPMHPDWARGLRDQCATAGVPFFFKQWGEWLSSPIVADMEPYLPDRKVSSIGPTIDGTMIKVGKKYAGRLLDGKEWNEFPKVEVPA